MIKARFENSIKTRIKGFYMPYYQSQNPPNLFMLYRHYLFWGKSYQAVKPQTYRQEVLLELGSNLKYINCLKLIK